MISLILLVIALIYTTYCFWDNCHPTHSTKFTQHTIMMNKITQQRLRRGELT